MAKTTKSFVLEMPFSKKDSSGKVSGKNEDYPETLTISAGPGSIMNEEMEARLGVYQRTNSTRNGRPEWEQVKNLTNKLFRQT